MTQKKARSCILCHKPPAECDCYEKFFTANSRLEVFRSNNRALDQFAEIRVVKNSHHRRGFSIAIAIHEATKREAIEDAIAGALAWRDGLIAWQGRKENTRDSYREDLRNKKANGATLAQLRHEANEYLRERLSWQVEQEKEEVDFDPDLRQIERDNLIWSLSGYLVINWGFEQRDAMYSLEQAHRRMLQGNEPWLSTKPKPTGRPRGLKHMTPFERTMEEAAREKIPDAPISLSKVREITRE